MNYNIEQKVVEIVAEVLNRDKTNISDKSSFVTDLGADSLDLVELMMAFEDAFGCNIPDEDASKIVTIKDAVEYIKNREVA